jgi:hypothetical protein
MYTRKRAAAAAVDLPEGPDAAARQAQQQHQQQQQQQHSETENVAVAEDAVVTASTAEQDTCEPAETGKRRPGRPKGSGMKKKCGFAGVPKRAGRPAGLGAGQISEAAAAAAGQRPVTRRRPLSYDARKQNSSKPAPLPYYKARKNGKFFVPEQGEELQQQCELPGTAPAAGAATTAARLP